jgi:putative hydroxymethylpyrimidine transport system ATP-binding protein
MSDVIIRNAHLRYGDQILFDGLDLSLMEGKWTCLLGPSGVGKSTLLRLVADLTSVGEADELTAEIADHQELKKNIAYMAQQDGLLPWLTVLDNVLLGAKLRGEKVDPAKAEKLLLQVGLFDAKNKMPGQLSGGMCQRAALVRTLMQEKSIVLMDEPFSALDAITRLRLQELAVALLKKKTVLFITHDPLEALRVADNIYVMAGQPASLGPVIQPQGLAPRDLQDDTLLRLQGKLLTQLEAAIV